jgi:S-DNA-T family DNA segregation ATPase FtsK/SpoIIIE
MTHLTDSPPPTARPPTRPRPTDDAPLREQVAALRAHMRAQAAAAARRHGRRLRAAAVRQLRHLWTETRKHRPSAVVALVLMVVGLVLAARQPLAAVLIGNLLAAFGVPTIYFAAYAVRVWPARHRGDAGNLSNRREGRRARSNARQVAAAALAYGGWLAATGVAGVHPKSTFGAVALAAEILAAAVLTWVVCQRHWAHLWQERRRLHALGADRSAGKEASVATEPSAKAPAAAATSDTSAKTTPPPVTTTTPAAAREVETTITLLPTLPATAQPVVAPAVTGEHAETVRGVLAKFRLDATVTGHRRGPMVTRYEIVPGERVSVDAILRHLRDFALALGTEQVRLMCPVPGMSVVGVEVPNTAREVVHLADVLRAPVCTTDRHPLLIGLGVDVEGRYVVPNLAKMPHLLVAGATGAGKSVCLNALLVSILTRATPRQVRLILIDPKRVELTFYRGVPHLAAPVIVDLDQAIAALEWVATEMDRRYDLLSAAGVRNIDAYNAKLRATDPHADPLPYLVVVVDEMSDLMMRNQQRQQRQRTARRLEPESAEDGDVEETLVRLGQLARAAGIHLVLATQRPSVDVVTGLIKANMPVRLAFATTSGSDSRVILDETGAERLLGGGDGLFMSPTSRVLVRIQSSYVSDDDVQRVVAHWREQAEADYLVAGFGRRPAATEPQRTPQLSGAETTVLAIIATNEGCSSQQIAGHETWHTRGGTPTQPTLSRYLKTLVDAEFVSRVKQGREWTDYRVTDTGRKLAQVAVTAVFPEQP